MHKLISMLIVSLIYYLMTFAKIYDYFLRVRNENVLIVSNNRKSILPTQLQPIQPY